MFISPCIVQIYGPLGIHFYGFFIMCGFIAGIIALEHDSIFKTILKNENVHQFLSKIVIAALFGARFLWILEKTASQSVHLKHITLFFNILEPGYSSLGALISGFLFCYYSLEKSINKAVFFDRIGLYLPLVMSIGKLGCFFAGCCHGIPTEIPWAITYNHPLHLAPLGIAVHPTPMYSSLVLFLFFILLCLKQKEFKKGGTLFIFSMSGLFIERFFIDFLRSDRAILFYSVSSTQAIALCGIIFITLYYLMVMRYAKR